MKSRQTGATAVEFALVLLIFLMFLLGIVDFSRMLFTWNAASEAARAGARYAAVCATPGNNGLVVSKMQSMLPQISNVNVSWYPSSCGADTCEGVTVTITGLNYQWISPIPGLASVSGITMPSFQTYLPREIMRADPNGNSDTICAS
jgi:Flp pilus assembly protein TadG